VIATSAAKAISIVLVLYAERPSATARFDGIAITDDD
jgi:hypothetical protein